MQQSPDEPAGPYLWQEVVTEDGSLSHYMLIHTTFDKNNQRTHQARERGAIDFTYYDICALVTILPAEITALPFMRYHFPNVVHQALQTAAAKHGLTGPTTR